MSEYVFRVAIKTDKQLSEKEIDKLTSYILDSVYYDLDGKLDYKEISVIGIIALVIWFMGDFMEIVLFLLAAVVVAILCYYLGIVILDVTGIIPQSVFGF